MRKSRTPVFRKLRAAPPATRALIKKQNRRRVKELIKTMRLNRQMAKRFATMIGLSPQNVPAPLLRQIQMETRRAVRAVSGKALRDPRR